MNINFDLLIWGCNTRCKHCYVRGGAMPYMKLADVLLCIEKLDSIAKCLNNNVLQYADTQESTAESQNPNGQFAVERHDRAESTAESQNPNGEIAVERHDGAVSTAESQNPKGQFAVERHDGAVSTAESYNQATQQHTDRHICNNYPQKHNVSFTLDHEPMNHFELDKILYAAAHTCYIKYFHHGMTTGIGLMKRSDRKAVIGAYYENGYRNFGVTLHGVGEHHDEICGVENTYSTAVKAIEFLQARGADVEVSLMYNQFFETDCSELAGLLKALGITRLYSAVPVFTPHDRMLKYEPYRISETALCRIGDWLPLPQYCTIGAASQRLDGIELTDLFSQRQQELYLTVHTDCKLYVGNSGAETYCIGDLRQLDAKSTADFINRLNGNRDYTAFYDTATLPSTERLLTTLKHFEQSTAYGDFESVIYRGLMELQIPAIIM